MNVQNMVKENCILLCRVGSKLYGTDGPDSDEDFVGIFIADLPYYIGLKTINNADLSIVDKDENGKNTKEAVDIKYYELREFIKLAMENNPNILEILFVNKQNIIFITEQGQALLDNKHLFPWIGMEKKFFGYARSQRHKMVIKRSNYEELTKAHEWLNNIDDSLANCLVAELKNLSIYMEQPFEDLFIHWKKDNITIGDCSFQLNIKLKKLRKMIRDRVSKIGNREELYLKHGYDCYSEETRFLTLDGWKFYDEIKDNDLLGTLDPITRGLVFQPFFERIKKEYDGDLFEFENIYTKMRVTPNHRMYVSKCRRSKKNNFSTKYDDENANWYYEKAENLVNGRRGWFHLMNSVNPLNNSKVDQMKDEMLILIGLYISDGTTQYRNNKIKNTRITQTKKGKEEVFSFMDSSFCVEMGFRRYDYEKETVWISHNKYIREFLESKCGHYSSKKNIPKYMIADLSASQAEKLLYGLMIGDGTFRKTGSVYYTINKDLANSVQILALIAGMDCNVRKSYTSISNYTNKSLTIYQVYIKNGISVPKPFYFNDKIKKGNTKKSSKLAGGKRINYNGNIVCFSVPNENLITQLDGKIAIQGNTKFASHLIRLLCEGIELAKTNKLIFPIWNHQVKAIKEGRWDMKDVLNIAEEYEEILRKEILITNLPKKPKFKEIESLLMGMIMDWHGINE